MDELNGLPGLFLNLDVGLDRAWVTRPFRYSGEAGKNKSGDRIYRLTSLIACKAVLHKDPQ